MSDDEDFVEQVLGILEGYNARLKALEKGFDGLDDFTVRNWLVNLIHSFSWTYESIIVNPNLPGEVKKELHMLNKERYMLAQETLLSLKSFDEAEKAFRNNFDRLRAIVETHLLNVEGADETGEIKELFERFDEVMFDTESFKKAQEENK